MRFAPGHPDMQMDSFTVLLFGLFIKAVLGGLFLVFWYKQRNARWYAWWAATFFLACVATVLFAARGFAADLLSIGIGNVALMVAFACNWQAARVFDHKPALRWPLVAAPGLWFAACLIPDFIQNVTYRVILSSLIITSLLVLSAAEIWRGRGERLPSRWPIAARAEC
jgi:hypothetical protein